MDQKKAKQPDDNNHVAHGLKEADLVEGLEILMLRDDEVFSAATLTLIHPPDLYGVLLEGDRHKNRPVILCQEEVLNKCVRNVKVDAGIAVNTRIVAYWSKKMHCLYPGFVESDVENNQINVDFDDGDSATIPLSQVRLLPEDFSPLKRRPRSKENGQRKEPTITKIPEKVSLPIKKIQPASKIKSEQTSWQWKEAYHQNNQHNGMATKTFYKSVEKDQDVISCGDCAVFLSSGRPNLPYIGLIESMWESWAKTMVVRVRWFYHPEEISGRRKHHGKNALYKSTHIDENDVQTISHICYVLSYEEYKKRRKIAGKKHYYYCAGYYDPGSGKITNEFDDKADLG